MRAKEILIRKNDLSKLEFDLSNIKIKYDYGPREGVNTKCEMRSHGGLEAPGSAAPMPLRPLMQRAPHPAASGLGPDQMVGWSHEVPHGTIISPARRGPHRRRLPLFRATKPSRNVRAVRARKASLWAPLAEAICACRRVYTVIDSCACEMTVFCI